MDAYQLAVQTMQMPSSTSVRLNPFKAPELPRGAVQVPWCSHGYILSERPQFTLDPLFHAGTYYVQDSSAMMVGHVFRRLIESVPSDLGRPFRVLDLCAAPGGKTTDLATSLREHFGDAFALMANEVMKKRAGILCDNAAVWGEPNIVVTSVDPLAFANYKGVFDVIVADVPCSGEGMFRKDRKAFEEWSKDVVNLCAERQKRILADVWPALAEGGLLIYSTCTFEEVENDDNLEWVCENLGAEPLTLEDNFEGVRRTRHGYLLVPGEVPGEGQYVAAARKYGAAVRSKEPDFSKLKPLKTGIVKGERKGNDFVPAPDYALSLAFDKSEYPQVEVDLHTALAFLHKDSFVLKDAPKGYVTISYKGHPLGFVKNLITRCNNLQPQSRRIRMDI